MMQIVIDIPEEEYNIIKKSNAPMNWVEHLIAKGIPLPKGHGRLMILSEDKLKENQVNLDFSSQKWISEVDLSNAVVTIIEVDTESEDKE